MSLRVAIACGGTGGHLFPGVAVAEELVKRGHDVMLVVSEKNIDVTSLIGSPWKSKALPMIGWPGPISTRTVPFFMRLAKSWRECGALYKDFRPDAVLGMGGFTSAVPLLMGRRRKMATLLHESNAIPGRVTRMLGGKVDRVLLGFADCARHLLGATCVVTGTPVRKGLKRLDRDEAAARFGLDASCKTILVMGGSQGAQGINLAVVKALAFWQERREQWQFIHLTGEAEANLCEVNYRRNRLVAVVKPFCQEMETCYSLADLAISRSGASSLTEISHYGLPSILIPFPAAAEDHQTKNARLFSDAGAAVLMPQREMSSESLGEQVISILGDEARLTRMRTAAESLRQETAALRVAEEVEKAGGK
jgi:UDP-N-acetylglucosamine--N-acetylmuramyl-(pentapeptide) pyrophosphoryl-undecaprenol N-acetylglucosamine transferase